MNAFEKYVNETFEMLNERSINKINKDFTDTVSTMAQKAIEYKEAEGDAKAAILAELKELTTKKRELAKELDKAVAGKDRNVELAITENILCEATVEMDAMDPDNKDFLKFLKKHRVNIINKEMDGPGGGHPVITMQGKRKDLEAVLADEEFGWADPDLAEYIEESVVTEGTKVTLKRRYTENHPAVTAGKHAKIRNKVLEAIKDGKITQEEFDKIVSELSNNSKRWTENNSKYFTVSEDGISLSKFGRRVLAGITINEKTEKNPEIWVPGGFDKELSKMPNSKINMEVVSKLARKHEVDLDDAIAYVEYGWNLDLNENKTNMKTQFIYESFSEFVNSLNESKEAVEAEAILNDLLDERGGDMGELHGMEMEDALDTVEAYGHKGSKAKKIAQELVSMCNESVINEAFASTKLASILTGGNKMDKDLPTAFYQMAKIALDKIQDVDIIEMDPATARKEKRANAIYMYFTTNAKENPYAGKSAWREDREIPANTLLAITNGQNEWMATEWQRSYSRDKNATRVLKTTKRDDSAGIAKSGARSEYGSGISSMKQVAELADRAYCLDLDILRARYSTTAQRDERAAAKKGAIAFQNDKDFKAENLARYTEILRNKASKLPIDEIVKDAIETMSEQIKAALVKGEQGRYGDIIVGTSNKGKEAKLNDAANHMKNILDDYQRYVNYVKQAEEEEKAGYGSSYYEREVKNYAQYVMAKVKQIESFGYAW